MAGSWAADDILDKRGNDEVTQQEQQSHAANHQQPVTPVARAQQTIDNDQHEGNPCPFVGIHGPEEVIACRAIKIDGRQQTAIAFVDGTDNAFVFHATSFWMQS